MAAVRKQLGSMPKEATSIQKIFFRFWNLLGIDYVERMMEAKLKKGSPVWVMNLGGKNRAGYYNRVGAGGIYVTSGKKNKAGWWISLEMLRPRYPGDGIEGDPEKVSKDNEEDDILTPSIQEVS